ncbi:CLUMA_CG013451, isoform A [Clunio marinus]|uniref:CLUMA_CG013451, isoform A n=1 Tax=Clunio marinus TaxID=568069 RepID=A0A1J1INW7_9DIPT|nr:CLUMA_CG013451, isoform A [Clunio marinus]
MKLSLLRKCSLENFKRLKINKKLEMTSIGAVGLLILFIHHASSIYIPPGPKYACPIKQNVLYPCKCDKGSDIGLYISCDGGNLASLAVALQNVAALNASMVEELIIKNSHFTILYGTLLHQSTARVLKIYNVPIKSINEFTFLGIDSTLEELRIVNSSLTTFPKSALKVLGNLKILEIDQHFIDGVATSEFDDSQLPTKLEKFYLTNGFVKELGANAFQHLKKVKVIDLHGNKIEVLKKNQFRGMRDAEVLDLSFNEILKLDSSHIADLTKLVYCNASHNKLSELSRGAFARNTVLRELNLSFNNLKRLDANSWRGMRMLRRLFLSDNQITDVGRGTFGSVSRIGKIDLARNQLKKVDYQMFAQLQYVELIDLSENNITEIQKQSFTELYLTHINISYNSLSSIEPKSFINCNNITHLDFSHNLLENIPRLAFDENSYASHFDVSFNRFTNMSQIPLQNMTGLRVLNVSFNHITDIPKNTFPKLYELHTIDASNNMISEISNAVFTPLFSLRSLNLSHNSIEKIKPSTFGALSTLLELDMSNNQLKEVSRGSLAKLSSLRWLTIENNNLENIFQLPISLNFLNFRNNSLREIPEKTWPVMNALLSLDLGHNQIGNNLRGHSFLGLLTMQTIYLNNNGISQIPYEALGEMKTLQYIHLQSNNITELPRAAFGKLPVVFEVNLHNNQINNISKKAFDGLLQLLTLNLSRNSIETIPNDAFFGLVSLRKMDLSGNFIEKLDNKTNSVFDDCLSLQEINLSHNKISYISRKMFPSNPWISYRLERLDLSHNIIPVLTFDITFGTKKIKSLKLSNNVISSIRKFVTGNLTALEILDLSNNKLSNLDDIEAPFELPENITILNLENNEIFKINQDKLAKMKNLKEINLENNQITHLNKSLIDAIKTGVSVKFIGNPLKCDCEIQPLKHFLLGQEASPDQYSNIMCNEPKYLSGLTLHEADDRRLTCSNEEKSFIKNLNHEYEKLPDIRFRDIFYTKGSLFIQWFVSSISKDIADFYLHFRDGRNKVLLEKTLAYDTRIGNITSTEMERIEFEKNVDVCILAKNSDGVILHFDESQCARMPSNFNAIMKKYNKRPSTFFKIYEVDRNNLGHNLISIGSGTNKIFGNSPFIVLLSISLILRAT